MKFDFPQPIIDLFTTGACHLLAMELQKLLPGSVLYGSNSSSEGHAAVFYKRQLIDVEGSFTKTEFKKRWDGEWKPRKPSFFATWGKWVKYNGSEEKTKKYALKIAKIVMSPDNFDMFCSSGTNKPNGLLRNPVRRQCDVVNAARRRDS